jgi:hypothetical protein
MPAMRVFALFRVRSIFNAGSESRACFWADARAVNSLARAFHSYCERYALFFVCAISTVYLLSTSLLAARKPLWNDELFTYHISSLPTIADIWAALLSGGEQIPPLFHIISRLSFFSLGANELALRLPEVVGFWVMGLCLFRFVAKRLPPLYGLIALLFPFVTKAYVYAYEARPYGIVLGFASLALVCWQSAIDGPHRQWWLAGLTASLAAAVSNHYYAILVLFPLFAGEAVRSVARGRLHLRIWIAMAAGALPLVLFAPLIRQARAHSAIFWTHTRWADMAELYYSLLAPALLTLLAMVVLVALAPAASGDGREGSTRAVPFHEAVAALGFTFIPILAVILAMFVTGAAISRYVLPAVIGFSILVAMAAQRLSDMRVLVGTGLIVVLCAGFAMSVVRSFRGVAETSAEQTKAIDFLRAHNRDSLPIAISDLHTFMTLAHYAPPELASQVRYLADPQASLRHLGHSSVDQGILELRPWFRLAIEDYRSYLSSPRPFLVYGNLGWLNWLVSELTEANRPIELLARNRDAVLLLVGGASPRENN